MKRLLVRTSVLLILLTLFVPTILAKNNIYKINDDVYAYYQKAVAARGTDACLAYVDSALTAAKKNKDEKGECVAMCVYLQHYTTLKDVKSLNAAADNLRKVAQKNGFMQYYYHAYSMETTYYINDNKYIDALNCAEALRKDAELRDDSYGRYMSYRLIGHIYSIRHEYSIALDCYHKAIAFFRSCPELMENQTITSTYLSLGELYLERGATTDSAVWYYKKSLENSVSASDSVKSYMGLCSAAALVDGNKDEFYRYFNLIKDANQMKMNISQANNLYLQDAIYRKDWNAADKILAQIQDEVQLLTAKHKIASAGGDYRLAHDLLEKTIHVQDSVRTSQSSSDISEYVARIGTEQLRQDSEYKQNRLKTAIAHSFAAFALLALLSVVFYIYRERKNSKRLTKINEQLAIAKDKAESASRMKSLFVQNMSHEIRTPLNSIMGFSQLLTMPGMEWSEEEKTQYGKAIMNNGQLLQMLIDDILSLSDLESGNYAINPSMNDVREICKSAAEIVEYRIPGGVQFINNYDRIPDEDAMVSTDAGRVQQILINFLTNACKHTREGSITLGCSLTEHPDCYTFSVTDTGEGVPDDMAEEIFERFAKLDAFVQGTGLGLNICRTIAELLGGKVMLDTKYKSGGARFVFILPRHRMEKF